MDRPSDSQKPAKGLVESKRTPGLVRNVQGPIKPKENDDEFDLVKIYLILYNWVSAILWAAILGRTVLHGLSEGHEKVHDYVGMLLRWTQTLAATEVLNSSFGVVRAGFYTTLIQVVSRFVILFVVVDQFPQATVRSFAYTTMILAWSATETIRYSYFVGQLAYGGAPGWLKWLRYNTFIVLYPVGILSEVWLVLMATEPARQINWYYDKHMWAILSCYPPGAWILFNHMLAQRKKIMRPADEKKTS